MAGDLFRDFHGERVRLTAAPSSNEPQHLLHTDKSRAVTACGKSSSIIGNTVILYYWIMTVNMWLSHAGSRNSKCRETCLCLSFCKKAVK